MNLAFFLFQLSTMLNICIFFSVNVCHWTFFQSMSFAVQSSVCLPVPCRLVPFSTSFSCACVVYFLVLCVCGSICHLDQITEQFWVYTLCAVWSRVQRWLEVRWHRSVLTTAAICSRLNLLLMMLLAWCSLLLSTSPKCQASWSAWSKRTRCALQARCVDGWASHSARRQRDRQVFDWICWGFSVRVTPVDCQWVQHTRSETSFFSSFFSSVGRPPGAAHRVWHVRAILDRCQAWFDSFVLMVVALFAFGDWVLFTVLYWLVVLERLHAFDPQRHLVWSETRLCWLTRFCARQCYEAHVSARHPWGVLLLFWNRWVSSGSRGTRCGIRLVVHLVTMNTNALTHNIEQRLFFCLYNKEHNFFTCGHERIIHGHRVRFLTGVAGRFLSVSLSLDPIFQVHRSRFRTHVCWLHPDTDLRGAMFLTGVWNSFSECVPFSLVKERKKKNEKGRRKNEERRKSDEKRREDE